MLLKVAFKFVHFSDALLASVDQRRTAIAFAHKAIFDHEELGVENLLGKLDETRDRRVRRALRMAVANLILHPPIVIRGGPERPSTSPPL